MELAEIGKNILTNCMNVKPGENVLIVTDDEKYAIGQALYQAAKLLKAEAMLMTMTARAVSYTHLYRLRDSTNGWQLQKSHG